MNSSRRRKGPTPTANTSGEDAWDLALNILGFEAMNVEDRPIPAIEGNDNTHNEMEVEEGTVAEGVASQGGKRKIGLLDLPTETQKQIFSFVSD